MGNTECIFVDGRGKYSVYFIDGGRKGIVRI